MKTCTRLTCLSVLLWFCSTAVVAQDAGRDVLVLRSIANRVLKNSTFQFVNLRTGQRLASAHMAPQKDTLKLESPYNDWRYWNGVLNIALIRLGSTLHDASYAAYSRRNIAFAFDNYQYFQRKYNKGEKWTYPFGQLFVMEELDDCGAMGASVIEVYRDNPQDRYYAYIVEAADHILQRQSRMEDRTLVRSFPQRWTLWADDLYMGISFLSRMGELTGEPRYFDDAALQVVNFNTYLFDTEKGLMAHYWYSDVNSQGAAFWGRANGWAMLAQVDLLDRLPTNHPERARLLGFLRRHILGIARYQSRDGLWHQLLDKEDSYLETSCSAMFTYAIARAVNKGYIEPRYASIAQRGWEGVRSRVRADGQIEGICAGTSVSDNLADYYRRPTPLNDIHGIGAVLLAGTEILQLPK